mgnify:CR=1 FL=1
MTTVEVLVLIRSQHQELKERTRKALLKAIVQKKDVVTLKRLLRFWEQHLQFEEQLFKEYYHALIHDEFCLNSDNI